MRRLHFIVNPAAGRGRSLKIWSKIEAYLKQHERFRAVPYTVAYDVQDEIPADDDTVLVAVGGDGTVHRVAQVSIAQNRPLAVIPAGTGNDFVRNVGIPTSLDAALLTAMSQPIRRLDVLQVNDGWTVNACGFGLDADVVHHVEQSPKVKRLGRLAYGIIMPKTLYHYRPFAMELVVDGQSFAFHHVSLVVLSNGRSIGGGMQITPHAVMNDGRCDICIVSDLTKFSLLRLFPSVYRGQHIRHPAVTFFQGQEVRIHFRNTARRSEFDGEVGRTYEEITATVQPGGLRVITPAEL
jgi:diacylglycerol kinase (ATP)